jgi:hypothetical protein
LPLSARTGVMGGAVDGDGADIAARLTLMTLSVMMLILNGGDTATSCSASGSAR